MIKVETDEKLNIPLESVWSLLTNISEYPKNVKFVKSVDIVGPLATGKEWHDCTSILWIPMRVNHKTTEMIKNKKLAFEVPLPFGGKMLQFVSLSTDGESTRVQGEISFDLANPIFNFIIGPVLKTRLHDMVASTLEKARCVQTKKQQRL